MRNSINKQEDISEEIDLWTKRITNGEYPAIDHEVPTDQMYDTVMRHIRKNKMQIRKVWFIRIVAVMIPLIFFLTGYIWQDMTENFRDVAMTEYYVDKGESMNLLLQDGSKVKLNSDTKITCPVKFRKGVREVSVEGEAFFEVAADEKSPFFVHIGELVVKVYGTSFNVKSFPETDLVEVALESGVVQLYAKDYPEESGIRLHPGDVGCFSKKDQQINRFRAEKIDTYSSWKENKIVFKDKSLEDVFYSLSRKYDFAFELRDIPGNAFTYTMTVDDQSLEEILRNMQLITPLHLKNENNKIIVTKRKK